MSDVLQRAIEYSERHYTVLGRYQEWLVCGTFAAKIGPTQVPKLDETRVGQFLGVLQHARESLLGPVTVEDKRHARWDKRFCAARMTDVGLEIPEPVFGLASLFPGMSWWVDSTKLLIGRLDGRVVLLLVGRRPLCQDPPDSSLSKREISRLNKRYPPICQGCGTLVDKTALAVAVAYSDILRCNECRRVLHTPEPANTEALRVVAP